MFKEKYKEDFDSITPKPDFIYNLEEKLKNNSVKFQVLEKYTSGGNLHFFALR